MTLQDKTVIERVEALLKHIDRLAELQCGPFDIRNCIANSPQANALREALAKISAEDEGVVEAIRKMQWIVDYSTKLRKGTDDWFDLVEIEAAARAAIAAMRSTPEGGE